MVHRPVPRKQTTQTCRLPLAMWSELIDGSTLGLPRVLVLGPDVQEGMFGSVTCLLVNCSTVPAHSQPIVSLYANGGVSH